MVTTGRRHRLSVGQFQSFLIPLVIMAPIPLTLVHPIARTGFRVKSSVAA